MSARDDIPADVLKAARKAIMAEVRPEVRWQYADGRCDHFAVVKAIAKAIIAERERCADIADRHRMKITVNEDLWHEGADWACDRIAAAIRALGGGEG